MSAPSFCGSDSVLPQLSRHGLFDLGPGIFAEAPVLPSTWSGHGGTSTIADHRNTKTKPGSSLVQTDLVSTDKKHLGRGHHSSLIQCQFTGNNPTRFGRCICKRSQSVRPGRLGAKLHPGHHRSINRGYRSAASRFRRTKLPTHMLTLALNIPIVCVVVGQDRINPSSPSTAANRHLWQFVIFQMEPSDSCYKSRFSTGFTEYREC